MNTHVNFEIAKLLRDKEYNLPCNYFYSDGEYTQAAYFRNHNDSSVHVFTAPTISDVIMWLYEKHGIWIMVTYNPEHKNWDYNYDNINWTKEEFDNKLKKDIEGFLESVLNPKPKFNSPIEAYEAAIEYVLKNLIK